MTGQPIAAYPRQRVRRWVPFALVVGLFVAANVAVGVTGSLVPEPHGHWSGHVANATIDIGMIVVAVVGATLAWRRLGNLWVRLVAVATLAVVTLGLLLEAAGNLRVAHSIWRTPYGDEEVGRIGSGFSGFDSGHDLAATGDLVVLLGGVAFALVLGFSRRVRLAAALAAVVLSFIPPPFILPACGVVFLLAALLRPRPRQG
jgi:hypothetical protein